MSCYFRHLGDLFEEAGIEAKKENRKALHAHIAGIVGDAEAHCPATWKLVKQWRDDPARRARLIVGIRQFTG